MSKPIDKNMQLAENLYDVAMSPSNAFGEVPLKVEMANRIHSHTAEALSEHKRVLGVAVETLQFYARKGHYIWDACVDHNVTIMDDKGDKARQALAAIAELKTNEKLG